MKTIYINGKFLSQPLTGVQRFAFEILSELDNLLDQIADNYLFILLVPKNGVITDLNYNKIKVVKSKNILTGFMWEQIWLPFNTINCNLINLAGGAPLLKFDQFCTFHDAAIFENSFSYKKLFVLWYKILFIYQSKRCIKIFTVSNFSRERLSHYLKIPLARISVIPNSFNHIRLVQSDISILSRLQLKNKSYFFAISSDSPSKNINKLLNAFNLLASSSNICLVLAGNSSTVFASNLDSSLNNSNVINAGRVSDGELKALYSSAKAFIFPSLYEGFGIPPLEAMSCNCPVIASDLPVIREVCGSSVLYIDPCSINSIVEALNKALVDDLYLTKLAEDAAVRVNKFSWKDSAILLYNHIIL
jgi:glycosyltransferase involved in cell wall biosynthesis